MADETQIAKRLSQRDCTQLSIPGDSPFARGLLAREIENDGDEEEVETMLEDTFAMDKDGLDEVHASS